MNCLNDTTTSASSSPDPSSQASALLALGDSLLVDDDYEQAISTFTAALRNSSTATTTVSNIDCFRLLSHRSAAYYHLNKYQRALEDAQEAQTKLQAQDVSRLRKGESEVCAFREGLAALALGRAEYARAAFESAQQMAIASGREFWKYQKHLTLCDEQLNGQATAASAHAHAAAASASSRVEANQASTQQASSVQPLAAATAAPAVRSNDALVNTAPKYQYYQSEKFVTVQILEPRVQPDDLTVQFQPNHLTVTLNKAGKSWTVICGSLYDDIDVDRSKTVIKDEKVIVKLAKSNVSFEWQELLGKAKKRDETTASSEEAQPSAADATMVDTYNSVQASAETRVEQPDGTTSAAASARPRPYASTKDWNKIEKSIQKEVEDDTDPTNRLFKMIYGNADEDTRRAMIKSYQTSGGTVLSTNWSEVKETDYEKEQRERK